MKHLKLFKKQSDYQSFIESDSFVIPNVSLVKEENIVFFNPYEEPMNPSVPMNIITYYATDKLAETTATNFAAGLRINGFNSPMVSHEFANGVGTITFEEDITFIGKNAFVGCSGLTGITIPDSVTSIGHQVFSNCSNLTSVTIGSGVTSIDSAAFSYCSGLTSITLPDSVTSIENGVFSNCTGLISVTIGSGVTSIGDYAFYKCSGLTEITCHAIIAPTIQSCTFYDIKSNGVLYYPSGSDYSSWLSILGSNWTGQEITN